MLSLDVRKSLLSGLAARIAPLVEDGLAATLISALDRHFSNELLADLHQRVTKIAEDATRSSQQALEQLIGEMIDRALLSKQESLQNWVEQYAEGAVRLQEELLRKWAEEHVGRILQETQESLRETVQKTVDQALHASHSASPLRGSRLYLPNDIVAGTVDGPYMAASNVLARDFLHPEFARFCKLYNHPVFSHRKLWEWAFIYHHVRAAGALKPGNRGLGFGVGREKLPSLFASLGAYVTATDSPSDEAGWHESNEHSRDREQLFYGDIVDRSVFDERVSYEPVDMNDIPDRLEEFDFCWSSCALEHLGSLQHGIDFIINSVEKTLKIGGVACHTTELNLSSDEQTIETGKTVIYRKTDLERVCRVLEERGHSVDPLRIEPGLLLSDYLVDVPPYRYDPHLKLELGQYVCTSVGVVARRGK